MNTRTIRKVRTALLGASAAALVLTTTTALAGSGVGGVFNLGQVNTVDAQTSLNGNPGGNPLLKVTSTGTAAAVRGVATNGIGTNGVSTSGVGQQGLSNSGIGTLGTHQNTTGVSPGVQGETNSTDPGGAGVVGKNNGGGPGLRAVVNTGAPPLAVNSSVKVVNLNADLFDGLDSAAFQKRVTGGCAAGSAIKTVNADGTVACEPVGGGGVWSLTGNSGTTAGTNFLGTSDNQPLELRVNGQRALRLEPNTGGLGTPASPNLVGGAPVNSVDTGHVGSVIAGGGSTFVGANRVQNDYDFLGAGFGNTVGAPGGNGASAIVGGTNNSAPVGWGFIGAGDSNSVVADYDFVGGGANNVAGSAIGGGAAAIVAGTGNSATGGSAFIGAGGVNQATADYAFVGAGQANTAGGMWSAVAGGHTNTASATRSTVAGGDANSATGDSSSVGGGGSNVASGSSSVVGGGSGNTAANAMDVVAGGGSGTTTGGDGTGSNTVAGGSNNTANGGYSTVAGGFDNSATGIGSFAAGMQAKATQDGAFVWGDDNGPDLISPASDTFTVRASGGIWLGTNSTPSIPAGRFINTSTGAYLSGAGAWTNASDRAKKEDFRQLDKRSVLEKVVRMPITSWSYKAEKPSIRHIGPMAQDFYEAFGLGLDNKHITTIDEGGVALAAIQGLYHRNQAFHRANVELRRTDAVLSTRLDRLEQAMARVQQELDATRRAGSGG